MIEQKSKSQKMREFFDEAGKLRAKWRKMHSYYHKVMEEYIGFVIPKNMKILEFGSFSGHQLAALEPKRGLGIDFSEKSVEIAKKNFPNLEFTSKKLDNINSDEKFDYILVNNIVGFVDDLQETFLNLKKFCRPDTKMVLIYHNHLWHPILKLSEFLRLRMKWPEQHWVSSRDLENILYLTGFKVISKNQRILIPFNIPIISFLFNKFFVHLPFFRALALNHIFICRQTEPRKLSDDVSCTVLVPCRNEKGNIEQAVTRIPKMGKHTEIIFVEGHSQDGTLEECYRVKEKYFDIDIKVIVQKGEGKGNAVREGFAAASCDVLMILDADLTVPPENIISFFDVIVSGKGEFINGSRLIYSMENEAMRFLNMIANKIFSIILTYLLGQYLKDTLCGTKVLWRDDYKMIERGRSYFGDFDPFGDFDLLFGAAKLNLDIVEIPVHYKARTYGSTQISRFKHGWLLLKMTFFAMRKIKFV